MSRSRSVRMVALVLVAALLTAVLVEIGYRGLSSPSPGDRTALANLREQVSGRPGLFEARPYTSYGLTPRAGIGRPNALGFRGPEWSLEAAPGVTRIVCLGASTTEGGNTHGPPGAYPYILELGLAERTGHPFEVMNCGVSAWTTAETLVSWFLLLQDYRPDFVIFHHAVNDAMPRNAPGFSTDYRHWRTPWHEPELGPLERLLIRTSDLYARRWLRRAPGVLDLSTKRGVGPFAFDEHGILPAETAKPFRRNLISIGTSVEARGGRFCLMTMPARPPKPGDEYLAPAYYGLAEHNEIMRAVAAERDWILIDVEQRLLQYPDYDPDAFFLDIVHMTPLGNLAKATIAGVTLLPYLSP